MITVLLTLVALPFAGSAASAATPTEGKPLFGLDDVFELEWATNPQLAPGGDRVDRRGRLTRLAEELGGTAIGRPYAGGDLMSIADGRFVYTRGRAHRPADVGFGSGRELATLTDLNSDLLAHRDLASVEDLRFPSSHDGAEIHGWLMQPPAAARAEDGPAPLILEIHGGPHTAYGPEFSAELQLMAAAGYAVLYLNPRGSTSYGEAFANAIQNAYPGYDYDDLMSGIDVVIDRGIADPEQLYVTGEDDLRTPIGESEQYYQALRLRGIDTALVRVPGVGHGIAARPTQLMTKVAHILAWFERHDGSAADSPSAERSQASGAP